jgi:hypothetical protein
MKLLVFAHTPPPHHGQSYMVQLMLEGFGEEWRKEGREGTHAANFGIECYHVNARFSKTLAEIGEFESLKLVKLIGYCLQAIGGASVMGCGIFTIFQLRDNVSLSIAIGW